MPAHIPLFRSIILFCLLLVSGLAALLPLFKFDLNKLTKSYLFIKLLMWIPLFGGFIALLYLSTGWRISVVLLLDLFAFREIHRQLDTKKMPRWTLWFYFIIFYLCSLIVPLSQPLLGAQRAVDFLLTVAIASALSDVAAFFFGNYLGKHKMPSWLNPAKSWEGVGGQFIGALLGVTLLVLFNITHLFWLWPVIGLGTAAGDLANSYVKRRLKIKDWGNSLPGHGGFLDRFSSLFAGLAISYIALLV